VISRLLALCAVPSVTGHEGRLAEHVELAAGGRWPVRRIGDNRVFGGPLRPDRPLIALFGHLDTVPGHPGDPAPHLAGDRVIGLGASDMKAGLAVMLELMAEHRPGEGPCDLAFVFYAREEGLYDDNGLEEVLPAVSWMPRVDLGFCLEPSENRLQLGCLGALHARVVFSGRRAHSARPWDGRNAVHAAGPLLSALADRAPVDVPVGDGLIYREVLSATMAQGGTARNMVPDRFELNLNYRFAPGRTLDSAQADVRALVGDGAAVEFIDLCPAGPVPTSPLSRILVGELGLTPEPKQAWTDVARLALHGIDAVNLGPGEPDEAHQAKESVATSRVVSGLTLYRRFLRTLTDRAAPLR